MKKAELVLSALAIIALAVNLLNVPLSEPLLALMLCMLALLYTYLSFALFNGIRLRGIFKRASYLDVPKMRILGAILVGIALSTTTLGILFRLLYLPGAFPMLTFGLTGLCIGLTVGLVKYQETKSPFYTNIFKRIAVFGAFGLVLMALPSEAWLAMRYRKHPTYFEALKKARDNPNNPALWDKVDEEWEKMKRKD